MSDAVLSAVRKFRDELSRLDRRTAADATGLMFIALTADLPKPQQEAALKAQCQRIHKILSVSPQGAAGAPEAPPAATVAPQAVETPPAPPAATGQPMEDIPFPGDTPLQSDTPPKRELGLGVLPRDPIWDGDDLAFKPPQIRGLSDWTGYTNRMRRLIAETQDGAELDALFKAHYGNLRELSAAQPRSYQRLADEAGQKQKEFDGG